MRKTLPVQTRDHESTLLYGCDHTLAAASSSNAAGLLLLLRRLGKSGIPVRGLLSGGSMLTAESVGALNLFLAHGRPRKTWADTARAAALTWI